MNYTFHQLQVFLEVVRQESVTKAARAMHMSQPAVSIQLKNFQGQFNIPLTEVVGKKLFVTDFGRSIAEAAERVIQEAKAINYRTSEYEGLLKGKLRVASASTGKYVMPYFLSDFLSQHRGIDLQLDITNKREVVRSLKNNQLDFALVSVLPDEVTLNEERLLDNKLFLVGSTPELPKRKTLIYREDGSATRSAMDLYFRRQKERKKIELTSNEAVKQAVVAGIGYTILPLIGIKNELANGSLHIIPSPNLPIVNRWRLVWLKEKRLSPIAEAYLEYIRQEKERIISTKFEWYLNYEAPKTS